MLKRLFLSLAFAGLLSPALASGTIPLSMSQQFDALGKPLSGCKLYTIQAGTTSTPQNAYQDSALTLALPNPQTCDAAGRLPQFFLADGSIKVRLTDRNGVTQVVADGILVIGPSGGGGGGSTVDPTTILTTGDVKIRYGTGSIAGFVRQNGRTIGSATSGATERANADVQALFEYLWGADANLVVSTGRGVSANADWVANKTLALPDMRGRVPVADDAMGNSAAGILSTSVCINNTTVLGSVCGSQTRSIAQANLPNVALSASTSGTVSVSSIQTNVVVGAALGGFTTPTGGAGFVALTAGTGAIATNLGSTGANTLTGVTSSINGNVTQSAFTTVQPSMIMTYYQKL